jgi:hypothetical protein
MKKQFLTVLWLGLHLCVFAQQQPSTRQTHDKARADFEILQTKDLQTGKIPKERYYQALERLDNESPIYQQGRLLTPSVVAQPRWLEIGPTNVGGRARTALIRSGTTALLGGVSGGLWNGKNTDNPKTVDWQKFSDKWTNMNISSFTVSLSNADSIYFATGEGQVGSADNLSGELTSTSYGGGIWCSGNGGITWKQLPAGKFHYINRIILAKNGDLFAATAQKLANNSPDKNNDSTGILVLKKGTTKFRKIAPTPVGTTSDWGCDLERAVNGDIYATVGNIIQQPVKTGKIYKIALIAGVWTPSLITNNQLPVGANVGRIEIACAKVNPANLNVLYAMYENANDNTLLGIYKTTDGGAVWSACGIPPIIPNPGDPNDLTYRGIGEQLYYNMALTVHPTDATKVMFGAENVFRSISSGQQWTKVSTEYSTPANITNRSYMHPDHHDIIWYTNDIAYFVNDGGSK